MREALSVVIPVYNAEQSLPLLLSALADELPRLATSFEVILVNDGSLDESWTVVASLAAKYAFVRGFDLMRNYGQHNALLAGLRHVRYPIVVTMDDDLQHPPTEIIHLLDALTDKQDVVYGVPETMQHTFLRSLASRAMKIALQNAMGADTARNISAFRAFRTQIREAFADYKNPFVSLDVLLTWGTTRFTAIKVIHEPRRLGQSNYTVWKLFTHAANMVTGFSALPLQLATYIGFFFSLFGIGVLFLVIARFFFVGDPVPGFPFLAAIIALFSGAQMFALGIIGEYLGRMHGRLLDKPSYAIRESKG